MARIDHPIVQAISLHTDDGYFITGTVTISAATGDVDANTLAVSLDVIDWDLRATDGILTRGMTEVDYSLSGSDCE